MGITLGRGKKDSFHSFFPLAQIVNLNNNMKNRKTQKSKSSKGKKCLVAVIYQVCTKIFPDGNDRQVMFGIKKFDDKKIVYIPALELFQNDGLLEKFSLKDIRNIVYTAAWEMFLLEKKTLEQLRNDIKIS